MAVLFQAELRTETQIASIAQTGDNVGIFVEFGVDGSSPKRHVVSGEAFFEVCNAFFGCNDHADVEFLRGAIVEESFVGQFETTPRGQHRVDHKERGAVEMRSSKILEVNLEMLFFALFTIGRNKSRVGLVEDIDEPLVKG